MKRPHGILPPAPFFSSPEKKCRILHQDITHNISRMNAAMNNCQHFASLPYASLASEKALVGWIELDMYNEAYQRVLTHPNECNPIEHSSNYVQHTPLGIACRKFSPKLRARHTNDAMAGSDQGFMSPNGKRYNTTSGEAQQLQLVEALHRANPYQIRYPQIQKGWTPLLDCITNPNSSFELRKFMINADCSLGIGDSMAMAQVDSNGLLPMHHLINQIRRTAMIDPQNQSAMESLRYMIYRCPFLLTSEENDFISPLIHLLSQKVSFRNNDDAFMKPIIQCAQLMLDANPLLVKCKSVMSKCLPLHVALRNGYGVSDELISLLLKYDDTGCQVSTVNLFGDLVVHIAATVGVSLKTWKVIIEYIVETNVGDREGLQNLRYLWSMNKNGYTPIHLMWMRKCHGDQQPTYPGSMRPRGRFASDTLYCDYLKGAITDIEIRKTSCDLQLYPDLAAKVLGDFWNNLCLFLQGTQSIIVQGNYLNESRESHKDFMFLHSVYALASPLLPRSIVDLGLSIFSHQIQKTDAYGRLPLHYAYFKSVTTNETCAGIIPGSVSGWNEINAPAQCPVMKLLELYPKGASFRDKRGILPISYAIESKKDFLRHAKNMAGYREWYARRVGGHCSVNYGEILMQLIETFPEALYHLNSDSLPPFLQAAAGANEESIGTIYFLLRMAPEFIM